MLSRLLSKLTYSNVVATLCLFVVLGGSSFAAPVRDAASRLITGKQVKDGSLSEKDLSASARSKLAGKSGPQGLAGPAGPKGETGQAGPKGDAGPTGQKGEPGAAGQDGVDGVDGLDGSDGEDGTDGSDGVSVTSSTLSVGDANCPDGGSSFTSAVATTFACNGAKGSAGADGTNGEKGEKGDQGDPCLASNPACRGPQGPAGFVSDTFFQGDGAVNQPNGQRREILRATGLSPGTYLVNYWTYIYPAQRYDCGVMRGSTSGSIGAFKYQTTNSGGNPETIQGSGVMTIYEEDQDQLFYCMGMTDDWSASNPRLDFIKIDQMTQGITG